MFSLFLLSSLDLRDPDGNSVRSVLAQPKRLGLLTYLVLKGGYVHRETLLAMFWPETDDEHARGSLRQALHQLRRSLGPDLVVNRGDDEVGIAEGLLRCDAKAFADTIRAGDWEKAGDLYKGDLLPGFSLDGLTDFEQWLEATRISLRRDAMRAMAECATRAETGGALAEAIEWTRRQLALSGADDAVLRQLLNRLVAADDPVGALRSFEDFSRELERTYGVQPRAETIVLVEQIRAGTFTKQGVAEAAPTPVVSGEIAPATARPRTERHAGAAAVARFAGLPHAVYMAGGRNNTRKGPKLAAGRTIGWFATAVVAAATLFAFVRLPFLKGETEDASIAILPIVDISADSSAGYIGDGMTEELISALGSVPKLSVTSRTTAYAYAHSPLSVREIGKRLDVGHVLEGTVQRHRDRLRLSIRLVSISDGRQAWSESYDRPVTDVLEIRDDIGRKVTEALHGRLVFKEPPGRDAFAADQYLRARFLLRGRTLESQSRPRLEQAVRYLNAAVGRDPTYARAHAELGDAYLALADFNDPGVVLPKARASAERALGLDPTVAETHIALGNILLTSDWDWDGAEREYRIAIRIDPDLPEARYAYARFLRAARRFDDALKETRRGLALEERGAHDPLEFAIKENERLAYANLFARRYPQAISHARRALELDPTSTSPRVSLALASQITGDFETAIAVLEQSRRESGDRSPILWRLGDAYAQGGRREEATQILRLLLDRSREEFIPTYNIGVLYLGLGDVDEAMRWFEKAVDARSGWWVTTFNSSPRYDAVRDDPRFQRLLRKIDAPT